MKKEENKEILNLLLTVRVVGILSLFEAIFVLIYIISILLTKNSIDLIEKLNTLDKTRFYMSGLPYVLGVLIAYIGVVFINYFMIKYNSKYAKKILIIEIVLLIILMTGIFINISGFIYW